MLLYKLINIFYFANGGMETGTWVTKIQFTWVKTNYQIRLREPLEIQTIRPKNYLKWTNELGDDGHLIPIHIKCKVIRHTLTYWEIIQSIIIPIHITCSPTSLICGDSRYSLIGYRAFLRSHRWHAQFPLCWLSPGICCCVRHIA